jgi:hypothetical protein
MTDKVKVGTILIEEGGLLPNSMRLDSEPYLSGWKLVKDFDGQGLEQRLRKVGWNFFYMADEIKARGLGFDGEQSLRRAVNRALANPRSEKFNSLEITQVASKYFLGLRYVSVSAHPRHIQESVFLVHDKRIAKSQVGRSPNSKRR